MTAAAYRSIVVSDIRRQDHYRNSQDRSCYHPPATHPRGTTYATHAREEHKARANERASQGLPRCTREHIKARAGAPHLTPWGGVGA